MTKQKYVSLDLSGYSPNVRHFDPVKKEYLKLSESKTAGLIPVRDEKEIRELRKQRKQKRETR